MGAFKRACGKISQANIQVERDLVAVLTRAPNRLAYRPEVEEKLGADIAARIFNRVARRECPESFDSGPLTQRRIERLGLAHSAVDQSITEKGPIIVRPAPERVALRCGGGQHGPL